MLKPSIVCTLALLAIQSAPARQQGLPYGPARYKWLDTHWSKSDPFSEERARIDKQIDALVNRRNDTDLTYFAEKAYREWKLKPEDAKRLLAVSLWYHGGLTSSFAFADEKVHSKQFAEIVAAWKTAGNPKSAEFSRIGYLVCMPSSLMNPLGRLGVELYKRFPQDAILRHSIITEAFYIVGREGAFIRKLVPAVDGRVRKVPRSSGAWLDRALVYELLAMNEQKMSHLDVAEASAKEYLRLKPAERLTWHDKQLLPDIQQLRRVWKGRWK